MYILKRKLLVHINIITSITCAKDLSNILTKFSLSLLYFFLRQLLFVTIIFIAVTSNNKKRTKKNKRLFKMKNYFKCQFYQCIFLLLLSSSTSFIHPIHPSSQPRIKYIHIRAETDRQTDNKSFSLFCQSAIHAMRQQMAQTIDYYFYFFSKTQ